MSDTCGSSTATNDYPLRRGDMIYHVDWSDRINNPEWSYIEPLALLRNDQQCVGCGADSIPTWSISDSYWEYAGTNFCKNCLAKMVAMLDESLT